jgi:hypothetical protein
VSSLFHDIKVGIDLQEETGMGFRCHFSPPAPSVWLTLFSDLMKRFGDGVNPGLFTLDSEGASLICTPETCSERVEAVRTAVEHANHACRKMLSAKAA